MGIASRCPSVLLHYANLINCIFLSVSLYLDYTTDTSGKISDERFSTMSKSYEDEQQELKERTKSLQETIEVQSKKIDDLNRFVQRVKKYSELDSLTPYALRELVKAIYVEAPDKSSGKRRQAIHISYDLVGYIPLDKLMKQETT